MQCELAWCAAFRRLARLVSLIMVGMVTSTPVLAQGTTYNWDDPNSSRLTRMWVPQSLSTVRGILIIGNGAGGSSLSETSAVRNQRFAEEHGFAVIGTSGWGFFSGGTTEISVWNQQLADLAAVSGHPELVHAPWAPIGLSNGGQMSYGFNFHHPEKTIAFIANKGEFYTGGFPPSGHAGLMTPGILIAGENDTTSRRNSIRNIFTNNRPRPALWAWVEQENTGHSKLANDLVFPFMAEAIRLRYPANQAPTATSGVTLATLSEQQGWLADNTTWTTGLTHIDSWQNYSGTKSSASWLMNENMAHIYRAFSSYDKLVDFQFTPSSVGNTEVFYSNDNLVSFDDPLTVTLRINTSQVPDWTKVELFNYAQSLAVIAGTGSLQNDAIFNVTLPGAGVYGLSALVTHADGVTVSTTGVKAFIAVPEPSSLMLLAAGVLLLRRRVERTG